MKTLYLVRHAKSSWKHEGLSDFERPLNARGRHDAPAMGELMVEKGCVPELIYSSPATRAITTARLMAEAMNIPVHEISIVSYLYEAMRDDYLDLVYTLPDTASAVMIVGHNPTTTVIAEYLTDEDIRDVPTCGIVAIQFDCDVWTKIRFKGGKMLFFEYPKLHHSD